MHNNNMYMFYTRACYALSTAILKADRSIRSSRRRYQTILNCTGRHSARTAWCHDGRTCPDKRAHRQHASHCAMKGVHSLARRRVCLCVRLVVVRLARRWRGLDGEGERLCGGGKGAPLMRDVRPLERAATLAFARLCKTRSESEVGHSSGSEGTQPGRVIAAETAACGRRRG